MPRGAQADVGQRRRMGAIASGIMATIGAAAILAVITGAAGGAFLWKARGGLALAGIYFMVVLFALVPT